MSVGTAGAAALTRHQRATRSVVARRTGRKAVRSGVLWGYIFGVSIASSALTYSKFYKTPSQRDELAATYGANKAVAALFGPAPRLQTVAGFTAFKVSMTLMVLGGIWGLLTATRLLRGEEDAGRWEVLLTGQTTRGGAVGQALVGVLGGVAALWTITALLAALAGRASSVDLAPGPMSFLALAMVSTAVVFAAVGACTSQLAATRRQAAGYAAVVLGVSYGVRMIADAGIGVHGLIWLSPLGWVEQLGALTAPDPWPLLLILGFSAAVGALAVGLAGRRDLGSSALPDRARPRPRLALLSRQVTFTARLAGPVAAAWIVAVAVTGFLLGMVAKSASGTLSGSAKEVLSRLGASGSEAYLGVAYLVVAVLVAFAAAGQLAAARTEEAEGRLDNLLVRPVSRPAWFAGRMGVSLLLLVACGVVAALCTWFGAATQHSGIGIGSLLQAGINVVPPAMCVLGIGAVAFGVWPRATAAVAYTVVGWSLLIEVAGGFGPTTHWLLDTSIFHQMAAAPAVPPDWSVAAVMASIGVVGSVAGGVCLRHRDLQGY